MCKAKPFLLKVQELLKKLITHCALQIFHGADMSFDPEQKRIVEHVCSALVVLALVGTGKSESLLTFSSAMRRAEKRSSSSFKNTTHCVANI